jgi:hypothetical protein
MSTDLTDLLRALPPELDQPVDRFDRVGALVRRRTRRRRGAAVVAAATAVVAVVVPVALSRGDGDVAPLPQATDTPTADATPTAAPTPELAPGETEVTGLSEPVRTVRAGASVVDLGPPPPGATHAQVDLACVTSGRVGYIAAPDGSSYSVRCDPGESMRPPAVRNGVLIAIPDDRRLRLSAPDGTRWRLVTRYVASRVAPFAVNENGQTYGVFNGREFPDLTPVVATNGREGYAYSDDLALFPPDPPASTSPAAPRTVPVYESDGETVIGEFRIR